MTYSRKPSKGGARRRCGGGGSADGLLIRVQPMAASLTPSVDASQKWRLSLYRQLVKLAFVREIHDEANGAELKPRNAAGVVGR